MGHRRPVPPHLFFGASLLPEDFPARLESFREASGLSWGELAARLGVETYRVKSLRRGALPGDSMMANLMHLAQRVPGGMEALFPIGQSGQFSQAFVADRVVGQSGLLTKVISGGGANAPSRRLTPLHSYWIL